MSEIRIAMIAGGTIGILALLFSVSWVSAFGHTCYFFGSLNFSKPNCVPGGVIFVLYLIAIGLIVSAFLFKEQLNPTSASQGQSVASSSINSHQPLSAAAEKPPYDKAKWQALLEFDPDIARVEEKLRSLGPKYVHQFAAGYLTLNDKNYLPSIVQKVIDTARQDSAAAKADEERWGKRFSDPAFLLEYADQKADFFMHAPFGRVVVLKKGPVLLEREGQVTTYPDMSALREAAKNFEAWPEIADAETRIRLIKLSLPYIPA
jgi:hypothetical protein